MDLELVLFFDAPDAVLTARCLERGEYSHGPPTLLAPSVQPPPCAALALQRTAAHEVASPLLRLCRQDLRPDR